MLTTIPFIDVKSVSTSPGNAGHDHKSEIRLTWEDTSSSRRTLQLHSGIPEDAKIVGGRNEVAKEEERKSIFFKSD
jgi:hypothetical protein